MNASIAAFDPRWPDGTDPIRYDLAQAQRWCERLCRDWEIVDPIAIVVGGAEHPAAAPLYAFARMANTFADDPAYANVRHQALDAWEHHLERAYHGDAWHPVFVALAQAVRTHDVPITPLLGLLTSFRLDLAGQAPATFERLLEHCRLAAGSVGRLVMHLHRETNPFVLNRADDLAVGLRLVDIIVDLGKDLRRGRCYLPLEDMTAFGVDCDAMLTETRSREVRELLDFQVARARTWLSRGRPLLRTVAPSNRAMVDLLWLSARHRLDRVEHGQLDPFAHTH